MACGPSQTRDTDLGTQTSPTATQFYERRGGVSSMLSTGGQAWGVLRRGGGELQCSKPPLLARNAPPTHTAGAAPRGIRTEPKAKRGQHLTCMSFISRQKVSRRPHCPSLASQCPLLPPSPHLPHRSRGMSSSENSGGCRRLHGLPLWGESAHPQADLRPPGKNTCARGCWGEGSLCLHLHIQAPAVPIGPGSATGPHLPRAWRISR